MFAINEEVLCIRSGWGSKIGSQHQRRYCPNVPYRGRIYTIRDCYQTSSGGWWVRLNEVVNPLRVGTGEPIFSAEQFVPIKRTQTDISIFTDILAGKRIKEDA